MMTLSLTLKDVNMVIISVHLTDGSVHQFTDEENENNDKIWHLPTSGTNYDFGAGVNGVAVAGIRIAFIGTAEDSSIMNMDIEACLVQGN